jgi:hypothetical protein
MFKRSRSLTLHDIFRYECLRDFGANIHEVSEPRCTWESEMFMRSGSLTLHDIFRYECLRDFGANNHEVSEPRCTWESEMFTGSGSPYVHDIFRYECLRDFGAMLMSFGNPIAHGNGEHETSNLNFDKNLAPTASAWIRDIKIFM